MCVHTNVYVCMYICVLCIYVYMANKRQTIKIILYPLYISTACINMHIQRICISVNVCKYVLIHAHLFILSYIVTPAPCRQLLPQLVHLQNALFIVCRKQMRFLYVVVVVVVLFTVVFSAALFVNMHICTCICNYIVCTYK